MIFLGDADFRTAFAHLGEIRSIIPERVNVLAVTATNSTFKTVCVRQAMLRPVLIGLPPHRQNIKYTVWSLLLSLQVKFKLKFNI